MRMRTPLIALLSFATGVLVMLVTGHRPGPEQTVPIVETPSSTTPAASSSNRDTEENAPDDHWPSQGPSPEQVIYAQPAMLSQAVSKLSPRVPAKTNLYLVTFAGDGEEDAFHHEAEYAAELFTRRFGPTTHALVLENHPSTLQSHPLATWSNLEAALDQLATVMKPEQDILVLYLTSHGDEDHNLLVDMEPLPLDQIGALDLAGILKKRPFKWKVVIVNACYAGGFIPALHGRGTLILTAARTDRSSFGCGSDSDITYFGKAWLVNGLNKTDDFVDAFRLAERDIAHWEQQDKLDPSEPQMDIGAGIAQQLTAWRKQVSPGPAVPFVSPPSSSSVDNATAAVP